jgi:predicted Zn-dependent peptidase
MWRLDTSLLEKAGAKSPQVLANYDRIIFRSTWPASAPEPWFAAHASLLKDVSLSRFAESKSAAIARREKMLQGGGSVLDDFLASAYMVHPYRFPVLGFPGELQGLTEADARGFLARYFVPANSIAVAAGDVKPEQVRAMAEKHFGPLGAGKSPEPLRSREPEQRSERRLIVHGAKSPAVVLGYRGVAIGAEDAPVHGALRTLAGRRLKARLLNQENLVSRIETMPYPAMKYPFLMVVLSFVNAGVDPAVVERSIHEELAKLAAAPVPEEEFKPLLATPGEDDPEKLPPALLATELADWHAMSGTWRTMFRYSENRAKVTRDQVCDLARRLFVPNQRTVAITQ